MYRREALAVTGLAALAGCLGGGDDEPEDAPDPIEVSFDSYEMIVSLHEVDGDEAVLTDSGGTEVLTFTFYGGDTATERINFIPDDTYTVTLYSGGEEVHSSEFDLSPQLEFTSIERLPGPTADADTGDLSRTEQQRYWEDYFNATVEVTNTGTAPISIRPERVYIDDPVPTSPASFSHSGINESAQHLEGLVLGPGDTATLETWNTTHEYGPLMVDGGPSAADGWEHERVETEIYVFDGRGEKHFAPVAIEYGEEYHAIRRTASRGVYSWITIEMEIL